VTGAHQLETKPCLLGDRSAVTRRDMPGGAYLTGAALAVTFTWWASETK